MSLEFLKRLEIISSPTILELLYMLVVYMLRDQEVTDQMATVMLLYHYINGFNNDYVTCL